MYHRTRRKFESPEARLQGYLLAVAFLPYAFLENVPDSNFYLQLSLAVTSSAGLMLGGYFLRSRRRLGIYTGLLGMALLWLSLIPTMLRSPAICLTYSAITLIAAAPLWGLPAKKNSNQRDRVLERRRLRARMATGAGLVSAFLLWVGGITHGPFLSAAVLANTLIALSLVTQWAIGIKHQEQIRQRTLIAMGIAIFLVMLLATLTDHVLVSSLLVLVPVWMILPKGSTVFETSAPWWTPFLNHPARSLVSTFLVLCFLGFFLLLIPSATVEPISRIDALFTSVSAVCVTGLAVLDTPTAFTLMGQAIILLLIQLGGLGIMTISTVALHVLGRRMTLQHERVLSQMNEAGGNLSGSLVSVVQYTLVVELAGALLLFPQLLYLGDQPGMALWRSVFTSISAFCNAGFALQSESLVPYAEIPTLLHTVAFLIIAGGIAPAVGLVFPQWVRRRPVPVAAHLALSTTCILLLAGFVFLLVLEYDQGFAHLSWWDKIHNAWFQSVTLRTAGFNSIDLARLGAPALMICMILMFIGGSPGGTAGGIKTATLGVLVLAMRASIRGYQDAYIRDRRIAPALVYRSIAVIGAGLVLLFLSILALEVTQAIPARQIVFESASALATVGLSIGATGQLDGIGKMIIVISMFLGRVGPLTIFMLLGTDPKINRHWRVDAKIPLT